MSNSLRNARNAFFDFDSGWADVPLLAPADGFAGTTTTATTTATGLSWLSSLTNAQIKTDMMAAIVNGVVTEAGLTTLMTDLVASLKASSSSLSASQFADLKTIAANLNDGVTASAYLTYVFDALVDGNLSNASWTGGSARSTALGNLAAGASATKVSELTGKWLQGTDLPATCSI